MFSFSLLSDRVTIQRASASVSATREVTQSWTAAATNVPSAVQRKTGGSTQRQNEHGDTVIVLAKAYFAAGVDVRPGDRIVTVDTTYLALFVYTVRGDHIEVELTSVRNG